MANISTSTVAYATRQTAGQLVFIASDGAACVMWCDGTNQVISYEDNTYATWTKATLTTGLNMALAGHFRTGTDNIDEVTGGTSNVRGNYRLLTKSGATWTVGTSNAMSGTTAIGVTAQGSPTNYIGQDAQGRHWVVVSGATNTLETCYYSAANSPTTTGWTASGAVTQTADLFTPAADQVGNYLIKIYWNGTALQWHRVDNSASSVGSWSSGATIANLTGSPNASHAVNFKAISATQGLLTYSSGSGVYAQLYTAASDSFGAATQLSTNANDRHPTIAVDGAGNAWVVWCKYAAANSFSLVYKKYSGSWGTETELVASGTNITYPNAGYGAKTLGVVYTQGTASPYTVGWASQTFGGTRTIAATASFEGSDHLTLYGSATADATLPNACDVAIVAGGVETSKVTNCTGSGNFCEVWSKGGSATIVLSIPTNPTGHGWGYQPGAGTFKASDWDAIITCSNTGNSGSWRLRFFKYDGSTTYTPITTLTTTITASAKTIYNFPASAASAVTFLDTDWLVWDLYYENNTNAGGDTVTCYMATSSAAGVANEMQITTPIFDPAGISGGSRTITSDAALLLEKSRPITTVTAALLLEKSRSVTVTGSLSIARTLATSAALFLEKSRTSGTTTASLLLEKSRTITTVTGALFLAKSRTITTATGSLAYLALTRSIGSSAALLIQKTNTAGSSAALLLEKARTSGSAVSLFVEKNRTVPSDAALSALGTLTRTVPSTTSLSLTQRTVGSSTALFVEQSRTIGSSVALSRVGTRSVPTSGTLSLTQVRTAGSSASLFIQKVNTVPSSTALLLEKTRTLAATGSLSTPGTNTRTVPASTTLSLAVRSIPASVSLGEVGVRTITATLALLVQKARTVPLSGAVSWQQSRGMASTGAILATKTRTLASSASCSLSSARTLPSSAALLSVGSRAIPSSVALVVSRTRTVTATGALSGARVIPSSVALKATLARSMTADVVLASGFDHTIPCSVALFLSGEERPCPARVALSLFIANARVTVPSGYALVKLP